MTNKFYNYSKVLSFNAYYNFIVGGRGIGKTYGAKRLAIRDAIKRGEHFIYLRRYREELALSKETFIADIASLFPDWEFRANGRLAQMSPLSEQGNKKRHWKTVGYFISLSTAQSMKSVSFAKVTKIIYDEFIVEKGYVRYLPDEAYVFNNFYSTVDRYQGRTKVFFLANSVSINNPYFVEYKIDPQKADNNGFIRFGATDKPGHFFAVVHFPDSKEFINEVSKTSFGKFIAGTEYADMAVNNEFSDDGNNLVKVKSSKATYMYSLETKTGTFSVWHEIGTNYYFFQQSRPGKEKMFTLVPEKMSDEKIYLKNTDRILQGIKSAFNRGRAWFDSPATRNSMLEVFK